MSREIRPIRNFPDWAESQFAILCDESGVVRNKSSQDKTGWDYIVEFERMNLPGIPHDQQLGAISTRVQVKSSTTGRRSTSVKLSNALRFCRHPEPCFVILFLDDQKKGSKRIYAREFDERLIGAVLKRAREADRDGIEHINRIGFPISFSENDEHTCDLIEWMRKVCEVDPVGYARKKSELNATVGYDDQRIVGTFRLPTSELQALIDHSVGIAASFAIDQIEMRDQRFDIPARAPFFSGKPDKVEIRVHPKRARLTFRSDNGRSASFDGEFRSFDLPGLGDASFRATFSSPHVRAEMRGSKLHISYEFKASERLPVLALRNEISFRKARQGKMTVELSVEGSKDIISLPINMESPDADLHWENWFDEVIAEICKVTRAADKPKLSLDDLGLQSSKVALFAASTADKNMVAEVTLESSLSETLNPRSIAYFAWLELGNSTFGVIASRPVTAFTRVDDELRLNFGHPLIHDRSARKGPAGRHLSRLRRRFDEIFRRLGPGTVMVENGDFMRIADGSGSFEIST